VESLMKCSRSGTDVLRCRSQQHRHQAGTIRLMGSITKSTIWDPWEASFAAPQRSPTRVS